MLSHIGRALQIYFPNKSIYVVNYKSIDKFIIFNQNEVKYKKVVPDSENGIIVLSMQVYEKYFSNFPMQNRVGELFAIELSTKNYNSFENIIDNQFVR